MKISKSNYFDPIKALNKAYRKVRPARSTIDHFRRNLSLLLTQIEERESEEFHKNLIRDFLKNTCYAPDYFINTKGRTDLVIHNGKDSRSTVGVIIESKNPGNKSEMLQPDKLNTKAFQELLLYYLRERITHKNLEIKHIIATNVFEWFIFDAQDFEKYFGQDKTLIKKFTDFEEGRSSGKTTDFFYDEIASPAIEEIAKQIPFTYFDIRNYQKLIDGSDNYDKKLIALFKIFSPEHLLKLPFANDSNSLNREFYAELLHIIGLAERKEGSKKVIERKDDGKRDSGSLLENAISQIESLDKLNRLANPIQFGNNADERLFNIGLELCITWINRILFLKLLEAQLIHYHQGDKSYSFLDRAIIKNFDDLNHLFFSVLARKPDERNDDVKRIFSKVPFLNSSLFDPSDIEHNILFISNLRDERKLPVYSRTVLKDSNGKRVRGEMNSLDYLFEFLNAYDFSSEGSEEVQEENKALISASVLGLIFEKINGYKDGSFFTPGFITMYMSREALRQAVLQKFNEAKGWKCINFDELYNNIADRIEANEIMNTLRICDPAVGSGHFLVSALNEIIAIKSDLEILIDKNGRRLKGFHIEVVNDELIINDEDNEFFRYKPGNPESQRVQETLFHEKQTIIENCLFGVDINPNSVKICRLRLWIELLKNAYYRAETNYTELETLPNIDINIKVGNSLVSRFDIAADLKQIAKSAKWNIFSYQNAVESYKRSPDKRSKLELEKLIRNIKSNYVDTIQRRNPKLQKYNRLKQEYEYRFPENGLFAMEPEATYGGDLAKLEEEKQKLIAEIEKLQAELEAEKRFFDTHKAFEWRFEFPEVLNEDAVFIGFDVLIGNPPYIRQEELGDLKNYLKDNYQVYAGTADLLVYFFERGLNLLRENGHFCMITSNKFMKANYGKSLRRFLAERQMIEIIDFGELPVFDEAATFPAIFQVSNQKKTAPVTFTQVKTLDFESLSQVVSETSVILPDEAFGEDFWSLGDIKVSRILEKMKEVGISLGEYVDGKIYYGIKTGYNKAFIIDEAKRNELIGLDPKSAEVIFPFAIGDDVRNYHVRKSGRYIILTKIGIDISKYPAVFSHLKTFQKELEARWDKGGHWWELRACAYYDAFEKPKIVYPDIAKESRFTYVEEPMFFSNTCYFIPSDDKALLGLLNSRLIWFYYSKMAAVLGDATKGGRLRWFSQDVMKIPIPPFGDERLKMESLVNKILKVKRIDQQADVSELQKEIDELVFGMYGLGEEERSLLEFSERRFN